MPPEMMILYALPNLATLLTVGVFSALGVRVWHKHRNQRHCQVERAEFDRLSDAVEHLRKQNWNAVDEFQDLGERIDFLERVLAQNKVHRHLAVPEVTPV